MKSKAIQRWMARGGRVKGYAGGGEVSSGITNSGDGYYHELDFSGKKDDDKDKKQGLMQMLPMLGGMNQGGFVNRLPYDYQDEPDFGASGVDTNYGSWDEEEDEQEQPAGITISFASALQKRKRR